MLSRPDQGPQTPVPHAYGPAGFWTKGALVASRGVRRTKEGGCHWVSCVRALPSQSLVRSSTSNTGSLGPHSVPGYFLRLLVRSERAESLPSATRKAAYLLRLLQKVLLLSRRRRRRRRRNQRQRELSESTNYRMPKARPLLSHRKGHSPLHPSKHQRIRQ
jgi:hypothetical protein